jgi:hypothetical protein
MRRFVTLAVLTLALTACTAPTSAPTPTATLAPTNTAIPTNTVTATATATSVPTLQQQLDALTNENLSNSSMVETAAGTYTFTVAVSSEVAELGGLKKFVVDDATQNDAMLYALARLSHWEYLLGQEGSAQYSTLGQLPTIDLATNPGEFVNAMKKLKIRPTTDILNHQVIYNIEGSLPAQEITGVQTMVVTKAELTQLKDRLQKEGISFLKANPNIPNTAVGPITAENVEYVAFMDNKILYILANNRVPTNGYSHYYASLELSKPDITKSSKYFNMDSFNYYRVVNNLFTNPFLPFEEWHDNHNRAFGGTWLLFGINSGAFIYPESTPQLQVTFANN